MNTLEEQKSGKKKKQSFDSKQQSVDSKSRADESEASGAFVSYSSIILDLLSNTNNRIACKLNCLGHFEF